MYNKELCLYPEDLFDFLYECHKEIKEIAANIFSGEVNDCVHHALTLAQMALKEIKNQIYHGAKPSAEGRAIRELPEDAFNATIDLLCDTTLILFTRTTDRETDFIAGTTQTMMFGICSLIELRRQIYGDTKEETPCSTNS